MKKIELNDASQYEQVALSQACQFVELINKKYSEMSSSQIDEFR